MMNSVNTLNSGSSGSQIIIIGGDGAGLSAAEKGGRVVVLEKTELDKEIREQLTKE
jgi:hypothetical protein